MKGIVLAVYKTHGTFYDGFYMHIFFLNSKLKLDIHAFNPQSPRPVKVLTLKSM